MQIQLTITEEFGDVVSFAEFAAALQQFLAGRAHHVKIGKTDASAKAVEAVRHAPVMTELAPAPVPEPADALDEAQNAADNAEPVAVPEKPKRGRPAKAKPVEPIAVDEPPLPLASPIAATAADPFAEVAVTAMPEPAKVPTYDQIRSRVLRFVELRPDRANAATEWAKVMKEHGYGSVADITNDRVGETAADKSARIAAVTGKLEAMISEAEAAKAVKAS